MRILTSCFDGRRPGGCVYQFTYHCNPPVCREVLGHLGLAALRMGGVWDNFPPASVLRISRSVHQG